MRHYFTWSTARIRHARFHVFFALLALFLPIVHCQAFTALYVFGDSLSDTGRAPSPSPQYYEGRYSNGPLWVEYLSTELGFPYNASNNFAVSGSTTADLASQITNLVPSAKLQTALFSVVSGGNDFLQNVDTGVNDPFWSNIVVTAVMNITNAVHMLYTNGAREIMVGNLANIGQAPAFAGTPTGWPQYIDSKVKAFNVLLATSLTNAMKRDSGLRIYALDDNTTFEAYFDSPAQYGFTVVTNGALEDNNLTDKSFNGPGANYLFWDVIHPTTKAHALNALSAFHCVAAQVGIKPSGTNFTLIASNLFPGLAYTIQSSTNLSTWADFQTITPASTNATLVWTNRRDAKVYYRVQY